ncbi:hypothetical protein P3T23_008772 [Paraburkholderia sp. GAS448]
MNASRYDNLVWGAIFGALVVLSITTPFTF